MLTRYTPSGRTSPRLLPASLIGAAVALGLAYPYQAVITWVPLIYINVIVVLVFGVALFAIAKAACAFGHNRNRILGAFVGLVIGAGAVSGSHYFAYRSAYSDALDELKKDPELEGVDIETLVAENLTFDKYVDLRVDTGWSLGRGSSNATRGDIVGPLVWLVWGIEALGLLGIAAYGGMRGTPYCERCKKSLDEHTLFTRTDLDLSDLTNIAEAQSPEVLIDIPPREQMSAVGLRVKYEAHACPTCESDAYVTITSVLPQGEKEEEKTVHREVTLDRDQYGRLLALGGQLVQSGNIHVG